MNLICVASYISISNHRNFLKRSTGYGYMVLDIMNAIANTEKFKVSILTLSNFTKCFTVANTLIHKKTIFDIFLNVSLYDFIYSINTFIKYRIPLKYIFHIIFYHLNMGYFRLVLKRYDLVHIHGISFSTYPTIIHCLKNKIKFIVTLHGLNSYSNSKRIEKKLEQDVINLLIKNNITITVISSGIKEKLKSYYNILNPENIRVILNSTNLEAEPNIKKIVDIRIAHNIKKERKILLCVGNISANKNQLQIVRAYNLLPKKNKSETAILFLGRDLFNGALQREIKELRLQEDCIYCGNIPKDEIYLYYKQADYTIVASLQEGFGLPIIEGYIFGLPNVAFSDLDSIYDVSSKFSQVLVNSRTDEALCEGLVKLFETTWDSNKIKEFSLKFSPAYMAKSYVKLFHSL